MTECAARLDQLEEAERLLHVEGLLGAARSAFLVAHEEAVARGDAEGAARAALGQGGLWVHEQRSVADVMATRWRQQQALAALPPESATAQRLRTRLAAEADYLAGSTGRTLAALRSAERSGNPVAVAEALSLAHHCCMGPGRERFRLALADALVRVAHDTGRRVDLLAGLLWRAVDLLLAGHWSADRAVAELRQALAETPHAAYGYVLSAMDVMRATRAGRFEEARRLADATAADGQRAGDADAMGWHGGQTIAIAWFEGTLAALRPQLEQLAASPQLGAVGLGPLSALAVAHAQAGDRLVAESLVARLREELSGSTRSSTWLVSAYGTVEAARLLGDAGTAAHVGSLLRPYAVLPVSPSLAITCFGPVHQALGVAALTAGDLDEAVTQLGLAVRRSLALGHLPAAALAGHRLAEALRRRGAEGDAAAAEAAEAEANARADRIGMPLPPMGPGSRKRRADGNLTAHDPRARATATSVRMERVGRRWRIGTPASQVEVEDCVGLRQLAVLVARPGSDVSALELVACAAGASAPSRRPDAGHEVADRPALMAYRSHLAELDVRIAEHEADGDGDRADRLRSEREWVVAELRRSVGLGGRARSFGTDAERARVSVTKAIGRALDRIAGLDADLAAHLRSRVRTGVVCVFDERAPGAASLVG